MTVATGEARLRTLGPNGIPWPTAYMKTEKVTLPTGHLEGNIRQTRANFSRARKHVEYALNAPQRQKWAREQHRKKEENAGEPSREGF